MNLKRTVFDYRYRNWIELFDCYYGVYCLVLSYWDSVCLCPYHCPLYIYKYLIFFIYYIIIILLKTMGGWASIPLFTSRLWKWFLGANTFLGILYIPVCMSSRNGLFKQTKLVISEKLIGVKLIPFSVTFIYLYINKLIII